MPIRAATMSAPAMYRPNVVKCWPVPIANASDSAATRNTLGTTRAAPSRVSRGLYKPACQKTRTSSRIRKAIQSRSWSHRSPQSTGFGSTITARSASARYRPITSPAMSIVASASTLASRRASVFRGVGERMYGRVDRTSSTGSGVPGSGSAATRRSYLADHRDNLVGPVVERMAGDDAAAQLGADGRAQLGPGHADGGDHLRERGRAGGRRGERQRQAAEQR